MKKILLFFSYVLLSAFLLGCEKKDETKPVEPQGLLSSVSQDGKLLEEFFYDAEKQLIESKKYNPNSGLVVSVSKYFYENNKLSQIETTAYSRITINSVAQTRTSVITSYAQNDDQGRVIAFYEDVNRKIKSEEMIYHVSNFVQEYKAYSNGKVVVNMASFFDKKGNRTGLEIKDANNQVAAKYTFEYSPSMIYKNPYSLLPSWVNTMEQCAEYPQKSGIEYMGIKDSYTAELETNGNQYVTKATLKAMLGSSTIVFKYQP